MIVQLNYKPGQFQEDEEKEDSLDYKQEEEDDDDDEDPDEDKYRSKQQSHSGKLSTWYSVLILTYCFLVFGLVWHMDARLPTPLSKADLERHPGSFIEERAREYLVKLTSVGARPAGNQDWPAADPSFFVPRRNARQKSIPSKAGGLK